MPRNLTYFFSLFLVFCAAYSGACASLVDGDITVNAEVETLASGQYTGLAVLNDYRYFMSDQHRISAAGLLDPLATLGSGTGLRDAVVWDEGRILLLAREALMVWDGVLRPSPLEESLPGASLRAIETLGNELWMVGENGLDIWSEGMLTPLSLDGEEPRAPLLRGVASDWQVMWTSLDNGVVALARSTDGYAGIERATLGGAPDAMAADALGNLWVAAGGQLHRRDPEGTWEAFSMGKPVTRVAGSPATERIWVATTNAIYSGSGDALAEVEGVPNGSQDWWVDDIGRLVMRDQEGTRRISVGRPIAVLGMPAGGLLFGAVELTIVPSLFDQVAGVSVTLGGEEVETEALETAWAVTLESAELEAGSYPLVMEIDYGEDTETASWSMTVVDPTWEDDIEPIYQVSCADCHGGETGTALLDNPESWEELFDDIAARVDRDNMPLGLEPLTPVQKGLIHAWGAKGFPR
jgi:hypothetical protein